MLHTLDLSRNLHCINPICSHVEEARKLLESLEAQQAAEVNTPPPRDQEHEGEHDEEPPSKRLKLRKKIEANGFK